MGKININRANRQPGVVGAFFYMHIEQFVLASQHKRKAIKQSNPLDYLNGQILPQSSHFDEILFDVDHSPQDVIFPRYFRIVFFRSARNQYLRKKFQFYSVSIRQPIVFEYATSADANEKLSSIVWRFREIRKKQMMFAFLFRPNFYSNREEKRMKKHESKLIRFDGNLKKKTNKKAVCVLVKT